VNVQCGTKLNEQQVPVHPPLKRAVKNKDDTKIPESKFVLKKHRRMRCMFTGRWASLSKILIDPGWTKHHDSLQENKIHSEASLTLC
jgi:hypothetical protein